MARRRRLVGVGFGSSTLTNESRRARSEDDVAVGRDGELGVVDAVVGERERQIEHARFVVAPHQDLEAAGSARLDPLVRHVAHVVVVDDRTRTVVVIRRPSTAALTLSSTGPVTCGLNSPG